MILIAICNSGFLDKLCRLKGNGENWCNGDCVWIDGQCQSGGPCLNSQPIWFHKISSFCLNLFEGSWSPWSPWSSCSQACGEGIGTRTRSCSSSSNPAFCPGSSTKTRRCVGRNCPGSRIILKWPWQQFHQSKWMALGLHGQPGAVAVSPVGRGFPQDLVLALLTILVPVRD